MHQLHIRLLWKQWFVQYLQVWHFAVVFGSRQFRSIVAGCAWSLTFCALSYTIAPSYLHESHNCEWHIPVVPWRGARQHVQENSRPVSVCGTIFICRLGICDLNQMPLSFFFFFFLPSNRKH